MTNEEVLRRARTKRWIIQTVAKRQVYFYKTLDFFEIISQFFFTRACISVSCISGPRTNTESMVS